MGIFETKQPMPVSVPNQGSSPAIYQADQSCMAAKNAVKEAVQTLGKMYYEANQNNIESEFYGQISNVKECMEKEKLWQLYRLSLEDKTQCDSCNAIITGDSAFCNKCGATIKPKDFSIIGMVPAQSNNNISSNICPSCRTQIAAGALFCKNCGYKLS